MLLSRDPEIRNGPGATVPFFHCQNENHMVRGEEGKGEEEGEREEERKGEEEGERGKEGKGEEEGGREKEERGSEGGRERGVVVKRHTIIFQLKYMYMYMYIY